MLQRKMSKLSKISFPKKKITENRKVGKRWGHLKSLRRKEKSDRKIKLKKTW